jgi:hypothetical protein
MALVGCYASGLGQTPKEVCKQGVTGSSPVGSTITSRFLARPFVVLGCTALAASHVPGARLNPYLTPDHAANSCPKRSAATRVGFLYDPVQLGDGDAKSRGDDSGRPDFV